jgi:acyl-coenzyme A synthetase/AMP-(fatty) acid ligase
MSTTLDWKRFEFTATVQTGLIHNAINRSLDKDAIKNRAEFSPATVLYHMSETFRAADMIPEHVTARQAAWEFTMWLIHGQDDDGAKMPSWFGPPTPEDNKRWDRGEE